MQKKLILFVSLIGFVFNLGFAESLPQIKIIPEKAELMVSDSLFLSVVYLDTGETAIDTNAVWSIKPEELGKIDTTGKMVALTEGKGQIFAFVGELIDSIELEIENSEESKNQLPKIKIITTGKEFFLGDTVDFTVKYCDSLMGEIDTMVTWEVIPDTIGEFINNYQFVSRYVGSARITARLDTLYDTLELEIREPKRYDLNHNLTVLPRDTIVSVGNSIAYQGYSDNNQWPDDSLFWYIDGMDVGRITEKGIFSALNPGFGLIHAQSGDNIGTAFVIVEDSTSDEVNTITITGDHPNSKKNYKIIDTLNEGERWIIGGMPFPLNIYNGGMVYFPKGCLNEDIRIHLTLPEFMKEKGDSVEISQKMDRMLSAIKFQVFVNDTILTEPYYFERDLIVSLVYKRGLLAQLNIEPENLGLYYINGDTTNPVIETRGIKNSVLDYYNNRILSHVAHFSTLAIMGKNSSTDIKDNPKIEIPKIFELFQNYPNPFNPATNIKFHLLEPASIQIVIYNILGQPVEYLIEDKFKSGIHQVQWNASDYSSGIYFIHMKSKNQSEIVRALLLK